MNTALSFPIFFTISFSVTQPLLFKSMDWNKSSSNDIYNLSADTYL